MSGYDVVPVELIDVDDKVVAVVQAARAGSTSGIDVDDGFAFVFTFEAAIGSCESRHSGTEQEALEAAGLSE